MDYVNASIQWILSLPEWVKVIVAIATLIAAVRHFLWLIKIAFDALKVVMDNLAKTFRWTARLRAHVIAKRYLWARRCRDDQAILLASVGKDVLMSLAVLLLGSTQLPAIISPDIIETITYPLSRSQAHYASLVQVWLVGIFGILVAQKAAFYADIMSPTFDKKFQRRICALLERAGVDHAGIEQWMMMRGITLI